MLRKLIFIMIIMITCLLSPLVQHENVQAGADDNASVFDSLEKEKKQENDNSTTTEDKTDETTEDPLTPLEDEEAIETPDTSFGAFDFINLLFSLFLVLALLYVTLRFIKKKNQAFTYTKTMMNLGGTSLGANRSVQLVKVGDRILVVGVGEDIQLLKEIDSKEEIEQILKSQQNEVQQMLQPTDIISKVVEKIKDFKGDHRKEQHDFKSHLTKQLSELSNGRKVILKELEKKGKQDNE
ncbi:flagellar biosynthetic protein FliO [Bacillus suaedaesalsae]|uniref:Flagellar biosynthetic protein FliO n=1 Tax=Bacillus suaedaesalsae TaxID=2810349 RepID=A0ABS2DLR8_9BACI|nr:flagellar biosynthetic protein FliO [Bacillus suaedaesalsae]MBM6618433.1 flagellar biosynthetic protein FliO [Bacillus suaedaesalsae]